MGVGQGAGAEGVVAMCGCVTGCWSKDWGCGRVLEPGWGAGTSGGCTYIFQQGIALERVCMVLEGENSCQGPRQKWGNFWMWLNAQKTEA